MLKENKKLKVNLFLYNYSIMRSRGLLNGGFAQTKWC